MIQGKPIQRKLMRGPDGRQANRPGHQDRRRPDLCGCAARDHRESSVPSAAASSGHPQTQSATSGTVLPGTSCPAFPADNVWNTPITGLPVNADSATWLASMNAVPPCSTPTTDPRGIPRSPMASPGRSCRPAPPTCPSSSPTRRRATPVRTRCPRPPPSSTGRTGTPSWSTRSTASSTRPGTPTTTPTDKSKAGSGAIWNLDSDALRPAGWTSADAAGLPILPGLVNYDEVASGAMDHAIRFTAQCTQQSYLWPARHEAGQDDTNCPPMGARFRLNADFTLPASSCSAMCQTVLTTMKTYGLILADNGSNWFFQGVADTRWTDDRGRPAQADSGQPVRGRRRVLSDGRGQLGSGTAAGHVRLSIQLRLTPEARPVMREHRRPSVNTPARPGP